VRTAQRWEATEGLPIRRHVHRRDATVFAYRGEIDRWREQRAVAGRASALRDTPNRDPSAIAGRHEELASLANVLDRALRGRVHVVFVIGEIGTGKTALVRTVLDGAEFVRSLRHVSQILSPMTGVGWAGQGGRERGRRRAPTRGKQLL
jgi:hypothetical protein